MVSIYCIEDINDLKYVGSTTQKLNARLNNHKYCIKKKICCTSIKLNLYNCIIYELEKCDVSNRKEIEKYWINKIDCVNKLKYNFNQKEYQKDYMKEYMKLEWYCSDCKCNLKLHKKQQHLKTKKHQLNINVYIND